ncbi:MAG: Nif11 family protein [Victivallales bacterium]
MSMDAINRFYDALDHNTRLQQQVDEIRLRHAKAAFQEFRQFAADNGFRFSAEEFRSFREELDVLSEEDMRRIVGGSAMFQDFTPPDSGIAEYERWTF